MKLFKIAGENVHVEFDVTISKKTGTISIKMKDGLCKFKMGKSNMSLSEVLNLIAMGHMGAEMGTVKQRLNEYGMDTESADVYQPNSALNSPSTPSNAPPPEEEVTQRQKARLGNV